MQGEVSTILGTAAAGAPSNAAAGAGPGAAGAPAAGGGSAGGAGPDVTVKKERET